MDPVRSPHINITSFNLSNKIYTFAPNGMDYNPITTFLDKFKKILFKGEENNSIIASVIEKHISSPVEVGMIVVKGTYIHIKGSPMLHSEVLLHKRGILKDISDMIPERKFTDIY
jgi:hypothetical protein